MSANTVSYQKCPSLLSAETTISIHTHTRHNGQGQDSLQMIDTVVLSAKAERIFQTQESSCSHAALPVRAQIILYLCRDPVESRINTPVQQNCPSCHAERNIPSVCGIEFNIPLQCQYTQFVMDISYNTHT